MFGKQFQYKIGHEVTTVNSADINTVRVENMQESVKNLFQEIKDAIKFKKSVLFISFHNDLRVCDVGQVLENISKFLCKISYYE